MRPFTLPVRFTRHLSLWVAILVPLAVFTPVAVFARNFADVDLGLYELGRLLLPVIPALLVCAACTAALPFQTVAEIGLLWLGVALYAQGGLLAWDYGRFDGTDIPWEAFSLRGAIDVAMWTGSAALFFLLRKPLRQNLIIISCGIILLQLLGTTTTLLSSDAPTKSAANHAQKSDPAIFKFSPDENVLVVLFDEFSSPAFYTLLDNNPDLKSKLAGFTYYRDVLAAFPTTYAAIPAILTGQPVPHGGSISQYLAKVSPQALPTQLANQGWSSNIVTFHPMRQYLKKSRSRDLNQVFSKGQAEDEQAELLKLLDISLFKHAPHHLKKRVFNDGKWFLQSDSSKTFHRNHELSLRFVDTFEANISSNSPVPTFKFFHLLIPHSPYRLSPDCKPVTGKGRSRDKYLNNARCAISLMERITAQLKAHGVYDSTTIVFLSDHGSPIAFNPPGFPNSPPPGLHRAFPLMLIKQAGAPNADLVIDERPLSQLDIFSLIAEKAQLPVSASGDLRLASSEERLFHKYPWSQDNWTSDSLPPITTFQVSGDSWDYSSWTNAPGSNRPETQVIAKKMESFPVRR